MKTQFIEPQKDKIEYIIGIDFGHGETSAAICRIDNNKDTEDIDLTGTGKEAIPSTMYIDSENGVDTILIGKEAVAEYGKGGRGQFHAYFKQSPDGLDEGKNPNIRIMKLFMKKVYETICIRRAGELMEGNRIKNNHVVFIACPSKSQHWDDNAMQNYVQLALEAGLPIAGATIDNKFKLSGIVRESRAAYIRALQKDEAKQIATKGILVIDYGSSTIDMTYYKEGEKPIDEGHQVGASFVEKSIFNYLKEAHENLDGDQNPEILMQIESTYPSLATKFLYSIRASKEDFYTDYSFANCIEIGFKFKPRVNADKIDVELPKDIITNTILTTYISEVKQAFEDFKNNVIGKNQVTLLVLTGGASRMNFVQDLAKSVFGENVRMLPPQDPSLTVSNGIATAGRADVLLYYLAKDLLSNEQTKIYSKVREKAISNICETVLSKVQNAYSSFYNGDLSKNTINALEQRVKSNINDIQYKNELNRAFKSLMEDYINKELAIDIKDYLSKHFPHYNISEVTDYILPPNVSMLFSTNSLQTLNKIISDAVNEITESFIGKVAIVAFNIIFGTLVVAVGGAINATRFVRNILRPSSDQLEYRDIDDDIDSYTLSFNDKNTELSQNQRKDVYNTFSNKKTEYENSLKREIENKLPNFENECSKMQTQIAQDYIISEINKIQLQIK